MMGSSSKYEAKSHQEPSCRFLLLNGVTKVFVQVQISKAARAEARAQKLLEESGSLTKDSRGTSSPVFLIQKSGRASVFSLPPDYWRILLVVVSKDPQPHFTGTPTAGKPELRLKLLDMLFNLLETSVPTVMAAIMILRAKGHSRKTGLHLNFLCHNSLGTELKWTGHSLGTNCELWGLKYFLTDLNHWEQWKRNKSGKTR